MATKLYDQVQQLLEELREETGLAKSELQQQLANLVLSLFFFPGNAGVSEVMGELTEPEDIAAALDAVNVLGEREAAAIGFARKLAGKLGQLVGNFVLSVVARKLKP